MSLSTVTAYAATPLYDRPPQRRRSWNAPDGRAPSELSAAAQAAALLDAEATPAPSPAAEVVAYAPHVFRADLTSLASHLDPDEADAESDGEPDFLAAFSALLATVMSGDKRGAQAAARALQHQIGGVEPLPEETGPQPAIGRFFRDLQTLIRSARQGDTGGAQTAAESLASDLRDALGGSGTAFSTSRGESSSAAEGATAAYETLMELNQIAAAPA